jgi:hypothetical protein
MDLIKKYKVIIISVLSIIFLYWGFMYIVSINIPNIEKTERKYNSQKEVIKSIVITDGYIIESELLN